MYTKARLSKGGFTLVELLVVIAIIAMLLAVLVPALQKARIIAKSAVDRSNQKQICMSYSMFVSDHPEGLGAVYNPYGSPFTIDKNGYVVAGPGVGTMSIWWHIQLAKEGYIAGFKKQADYWDTAVSNTTPIGVLNCPAVAKYEPVPGWTIWNTWKGSAYGLNRHLYQSVLIPPVGFRFPEGTYINPKKIMSIPQPARVCLLSDGNFRCDLQTAYDGRGYQYTAEIYGNTVMTDRHGKGNGLVVYVDGHVGKAPIAQGAPSGIKMWPNYKGGYQSGDAVKKAEYVSFWSNPQF